MAAKITECRIAGEQDIYRSLRHHPPDYLISCKGAFQPYSGESPWTAPYLVIKSDINTETGTTCSRGQVALSASIPWGSSLTINMQPVNHEEIIRHMCVGGCLFIFYFFLGLHPRHMEFPRLGAESEP